MYICSFFSPLAFVWQKLKLEERETGKSMLQGVRTQSPRTQNTGQDTVTQDTGNSTQSPRTFNYQESVDQYYWLCHISALFICLLTSSTKGCCWKLTTHLSIITLAGFPNDSTLLKSRGWGTWLFITQSSISPFLHLSWKPWMSAVSFGFSMFQRGSRSLISHRRFHLPFNTGYLPMVFYIPLISTWSPRQQQLLSHGAVTFQEKVPRRMWVFSYSAVHVCRILRCRVNTRGWERTAEPDITLWRLRRRAMLNTW